jgi:glutamate formiminotransferase
MSPEHARIVECIANFSEGRDPSVVGLIAEAIASVSSVYVLRREGDVDHNRSVITFAGEPEAVVEAAVRGVSRAVGLIDLTRHTGEHPRMGAADVVPFVPIRGITMAECALLARRAGERIWAELGVPVYLYEESALVPEHRNLADLRRGQFEAIRETISIDRVRAPDIGEPRVHPTAGITAVGARHPLIAYNVDLGTTDIAVARAIARTIRHSSGGLPHVKALGFERKTRGVVQVSMNLVNHRGTGIHEAFEAVRAEAERLGVPIVSSEIIGLVPQEALIAAAEFYLKLADFNPGLVLENCLLSAMTQELKDEKQS